MCPLACFLETAIFHKQLLLITSYYCKLIFLTIIVLLVLQLNCLVFFSDTSNFKNRFRDYNKDSHCICMTAVSTPLDKLTLYVALTSFVLQVTESTLKGTHSAPGQRT